MRSMMGRLQVWIVGCGTYVIGAGGCSMLGAPGASETGSSMMTSAATDASATAAATTASADSADATSTSTGTGSVFVSSPDLGDGSECSFLAQDCPAGWKCAPWAEDGGSAFNAAKCVPIVEDPAQEGEPCQVVGSGTSGVDDCDLGLICWYVVPQTGVGSCVPLCQGSWVDFYCVDPGQLCDVFADASLAICIEICDPLAPACAPEESCLPDYWGGWACGNDHSGDMGALGDPCSQTNECDPGLVCADAQSVPHGEACADASGCCSELCDLTDPAGDLQCTAAADGAICRPWGDWLDEDPPVGLEHVGWCAFPP